MKSYKLMNYTSSVPAEKSILDIERLLWSAGATKIAKDANRDGTVTAFIFALPVGVQQIPFRLPCNIDKVFAVLMANYKRPHRGTKEKVRAQSERVAWRILLSWIDAQVTMIRLDQARPEEVFLPYMWNGKQTLFQQFQSKDFLLPASTERSNVD